MSSFAPLNRQKAICQKAFLATTGAHFVSEYGCDLMNDGSLDSAPWGWLVDDVAVTDGGSSDRAYSSTVLSGGFDGVSYTPGGASRIPDGTDTDSVADWMRNDYDGEGLPGFTGTPDLGEALNTPEAVNEAATGSVTDPLINELVFNHTGTDGTETQYTNFHFRHDYTSLKFKPAYLTRYAGRRKKTYGLMRRGQPLRRRRV